MPHHNSMMNRDLFRYDIVDRPFSNTRGKVKGTSYFTKYASARNELYTLYFSTSNFDIYSKQTNIYDLPWST